MALQVFTGEQKITISPATGFEELYYKVGESKLEAKTDLSGDTYTITLKSPIAITKNRVGTKNRVELHMKAYGAKEEIYYLGDYAFSPSIEISSPSVVAISDMSAYYPTFKVKVLPDVGAFTGDILLSLNGKDTLNLTQNYGASMQKVENESISEYGIYKLSLSSPLRNSELGLNIETSSTISEKYTLSHSALYNTVDISQTSSWSKVSAYMESPSVTVDSLDNIIPSFKVGFNPNKGTPSKIRYKLGSSTTWHDMAFSYVSIPEESGNGYFYNYKVTASSAIPKSLLTSEGGLTEGTSGSTNIVFQISNSMSPNEYFSKECRYSVTYNALPAIGTSLADMSWADIRRISDAGVAPSYFAVGDRKGVYLYGALGGLELSSFYWCYILSLDHNSVLEGKNRIHFQFGYNGDKVPIAFVDSKCDSQITSGVWLNMNNSNTNVSGWKGSALRINICSAFWHLMPSDLRAVLKTVTKYTDNTGGGNDTASYVTATSETVFLLSEFEVFGTRTYANSAEQNYQVQYAYYRLGYSKTRYKHNATSESVGCWLRSVRSGYSGSFCGIGTSGGAVAYAASKSKGFAPAFCV